MITFQMAEKLRLPSRIRRSEGVRVRRTGPVIGTRRSLRGNVVWAAGGEVRRGVSIGMNAVQGRLEVEA
jgi:hypothetical protein